VRYTLDARLVGYILHLFSYPPSTLLTTMKLSSNIPLISELIAFTLAGLGPTLKAIVKTPSLLLHPNGLSRLFMSHVWAAYGNSVDEAAQSTKTHLITPNAHGIVLDIGAGMGIYLYFVCQSDAVHRSRAKYTYAFPYPGLR